MNGGWRYRLLSVAGTAALAAVAVAVANHAVVQGLFQLLPVVGHLPFDSAAGREFVIEASIATVVVCGALFPLYKPRPRRILDIGLQALRRVSIALFALATIGYFDFTYRIPRATLLVTGVILFLMVPPWFVLIRRQPHPSGDRMVIIGDDPETMADILEVVEGNVLGYVSPLSAYTGRAEPYTSAPEVADGGTPSELDELVNLGGLSRLDEVLVEYDVGTAVLAFAQPDRGEFFGALEVCSEHGVPAKVHQEHADSVLTDGVVTDDLVNIELEPWDWQDRMLKRGFDVVFAAVGLVISAPVMICIVAAIKLEDGGDVLYSQDRTAMLGDTFRVFKFRSMIENAEEVSGATLSEEDSGGVDPRVTQVGRMLRRTHLDEIPQLWSILLGKMSVVGPRPERPELESEMETDVGEWSNRWFVKPGLTGLAQINDVTGFDPHKKLQYDIAYIRKQSFWFDLKIVVRQVWKVGRDLVATIQGRT
jgi:lipopolysaccharide/colanic/teichoic acid biosynthesis glycosyltransferase